MHVRGAIVARAIVVFDLSTLNPDQKLEIETERGSTWTVSQTPKWEVVASEGRIHGAKVETTSDRVDPRHIQPGKNFVQSIVKIGQVWECSPWRTGAVKSLRLV
jgi:hypothetical protein